MAIGHLHALLYPMEKKYPEAINHVWKSELFIPEHP